MEFLVSFGIRAMEWLGDRIYDFFDKSPPSLPPAPKPQVSVEDLRKDAQKKLGMDVLNRYNFAVCGSSGTGLCDVEFMYEFPKRPELFYFFRQINLDQLHSQCQRY